MSRPRALVMVLLGVSLLACRKESPAASETGPKFDSLPGRVPTMSDLTLLGAATDTNGLVASVLTPLAASCSPIVAPPNSSRQDARE